MLSPVSLVDCAVFVLFLAINLPLQAGLVSTITTALRALPFLLWTLPAQLARAHFVPPTTEYKGPCTPTTLFQNVVLRCTKWAFVNVPPNVGRVFFARAVVLPFFWFRLLRHGYRAVPVDLCEIDEPAFKGVWLKKNASQAPDVVVYYIHGGGFALGSTYFYLEFLLQWCELLASAGYRNPAIFSLEYTLVPNAHYPTQLHQAIAAYEHVLAVAGNPRRVCLGADSAGATLALSLILELAARRDKLDGRPQLLLPKPQLAVLVSPWTSLMMCLHKNTDGDFLDKTTLWRYAHEYAGTENLHRWPANPGSCRDNDLWRRASPRCGFYVVSGGQEVLNGDVRDFVTRQRRRGVEVESIEMSGRPHAWPVAALYLGRSVDERLEGLRIMVAAVSKRIPIGGELMP